MKNNTQYRKLLVDDQDGWFTMVVQYHRHFIISHWVTIKTLESQDIEKLNKAADIILEALNVKLDS